MMLAGNIFRQSCVVSGHRKWFMYCFLYVEDILNNHASPCLVNIGTNSIVHCTIMRGHIFLHLVNVCGRDFDIIALECLAYSSDRSHIEHSIQTSSGDSRDNPIHNRYLTRVRQYASG